MVQDQLRRRGLTDPRVLKLMGEIPREDFMPPEMSVHAYEDRALSVGHGQTISQPYMVALMTTLLDVQPGHRVLEVGTGTGYQTLILARLAGSVVTVERIAPLSAAARERLVRLNVTNVRFHVGDGSRGCPDEGPYHRIMVTAGAPRVPRALPEQLADGGRMVVPVGALNEQILTTVERVGAKTVETPGIACRFVQLIGQDGWPECGAGPR
jgi:protein-L-isoaspartate(D-aspartate) O-methyltransferase